MTLKNKIYTLKDRLKAIRLLFDNKISVDELQFSADLVHKIRAGDFTRSNIKLFADILSESKPDVRILNLAIELVKEISSQDFNEFKHITNVKNYRTNNHDSDLIIELLDVFKEIIKANIHTDTDTNNIYSLVTQLVNINKLSKDYDADALTTVQSYITQFKKETFNPDFILSRCFSQEGEDLILQRLFPADKKGFFVDIGAHHPTRFSNTYMLYRMGWRGINIDPMPGIMKLFNDIRPDDINLEVSVGDKDATSKDANYVSFREPAYNSIYIEDIDEVKNTIYSEIIDIVKVKVQSLDEILDKHSDSFTEINLLTIDVEGFEMEVLKGFSIEKYMPNIIILEIRGFDIDLKEQSEEYGYIVNNGYKLRSILFHSVIFQRIDR